MKSLAVFFFILYAALANAQRQHEVDSTSLEAPLMAPEEMPAYPGGESALLKYLHRVNYPLISMEDEFPRTIHVRFIVEKMVKYAKAPSLKAAALPEWIVR